MKYVIPIAIEQTDAVKLLGTLPQTATQTRNALAAKVAELIEEKTSEKPVEEAKTPVEEGETPTPRKKATVKKSAK